jgi:hypothetical protein
MVQIDIEPLASGRYRVFHGDEVLIGAARTPFFSGARALIARGQDPKDIVEMRRKGSSEIAMRGRLEHAAALTVIETGKSGPRLSEFREMPVFG